MRKRKATDLLKIQVDEKGRPDKLISNSTKEFDAIIARNAAGEFIVTELAVGESNGQWVFHVWYPQPKQSHMFE